MSSWILFGRFYSGGRGQEQLYRAILGRKTRMMSELHPLIARKPFLVGEDDCVEVKRLDANKQRHSIEPCISRIQNGEHKNRLTVWACLSSLLAILSNAGYRSMAKSSPMSQISSYEIKTCRPRKNRKNVH